MDSKSYMETMADMFFILRKQAKTSDYAAANATIGLARRLTNLASRATITGPLKECMGRNFEYIASRQPELTGIAQLTILYLECYETVLKVSLGKDYGLTRSIHFILRRSSKAVHHRPLP